MSTPLDTPPSAESVVAALTLAVGQVLRRLRTEANPDGLNLSQSAALARLEANGGMTTAELARAEAMTPQSMGSILAGFERDGLVVRKAHSRDGRQILFSLTASGAEVLRQRSVAKQTWLMAAVAKLDPGERRRLLSAAALIRRLGDS